MFSLTALYALGSLIIVLAIMLIGWRWRGWQTGVIASIAAVLLITAGYFALVAMALNNMN